MGGGTSKIAAAASKYSMDQSQDPDDDEMDDEADEDDDDDDIVWENGLLDLGSQTLTEDELEQSMSDSETLVGRRRVTRRRRSQTWSHPIPEEPPKSVRRSFICCSGNSVAFQVAVNFKPHISDLADVGGDND